MLELSASFRIVWAWRRFLVGCVILAAASAAVVAYLRTPIYRAESTLVAGPMLEAFPLAEADLRLGQELARNFAHLAVSDRVLRGAAQRLGGDADPGRLSSRVSAQALPGTQFLRITAVAAGYEHARSIANAVAEQLIAAVAERNEESTGMRGTLNRELRGLEADLKSARDELERLRAQAAAADTDEIKTRITLLERKIDSWRSAYGTVLNQAKGTQRLAVWQPAGGPTAPVSPSPAFTILVAVAGAFLVAMVGILLFEYPFTQPQDGLPGA